MKNRYYIAEQVKENDFTALNKARSDIEAVFSQLGYKKLNAYINIVKSRFKKLKFIEELLINLAQIKQKDIIYFQYPYYENNKKIFTILKVIKKIRNTTMVAIIHDIDSIRFDEGKEKIRGIKREIKLLSNFDYIISHNEKMTRFLTENGINIKIINLNIFDYLLNEDDSNINLRKNDIVFAGNLSKEKSTFIYNLINNDEFNCTMNLYGPNFTGNITNKRIKYLGKYLPNELIKNIEGKFGLIWDGDMLEKCSGKLGEYTKYNNPHKLSMYIAAGLPIICWNKMAISEFVVENNIGICIDSINKLDEKIKEIDQVTYNKMLNKVLNLRKKIIDGYFIKDALSKI